MTEQPAPANVVTPRPTTIRYAIIAALTWGVLNFVAGLSLWLFKSAVKTSLRKADAKSTASNKRDYLAHPNLLDKDVHQALLSATVSAVFIMALIGFTAYGIKFAKGWARWVVVALNLLNVVGLPLVSSAIGVLGLATALGSTDFPAVYRVLVGVTALVAVVLLVLLFTRSSRDWFIENRPARPAPGSAPPGGLFGMFAPKPRATAPVADAVEPAEVVGEPADADSRRAGRGKAKVRASESTAPPSRPANRGPAGKRPSSKSRKA